MIRVQRCSMVPETGSYGLTELQVMGYSLLELISSRQKYFPLKLSSHHLQTDYEYIFL